MKRLLVTGSRDLTDHDLVRDALRKAWKQLQPGPIVLVHGAARGADTIARDIWVSGKLLDEPHPADWAHCRPECAHPPRKHANGRPWCPAAGSYRNQEMVDLGADLCVGFPLGDGWSGTRDCMRRARAAGIPVREFVAGRGETVLIM
ncbi:SLOG family protein [Nocardia flavorosea]|uniref:DUF2493 domain-containing protein n=1 Tax=Nocardia flavorosea TaxID=53429 RepID=A0A846YNT9_9NOCA|nr:SLOG family protein [Nocardia flavorosea]NKY60443.1 DUF2493 domain-containing protein [Nocardia flavorosea]